MSDRQIESIIIEGKVLAPLDYGTDNGPAIPHEAQSTERQDIDTHHTRQQVFYFCYLFIHVINSPLHLTVLSSIAILLISLSFELSIISNIWQNEI